MEETYPIVKFPRNLQFTFNWNPLEEDRPKKPFPPQQPSPISKSTLPPKPVEPRLDKNDVGCLGLFLIPVIFFCFYMANDKHSGFFGFLGWVLIVTLIYFTIKIVNGNYNKEKIYNITISDYPKILKEWNAECEKINDEYDKSFRKQELDFKMDNFIYESTDMKIYHEELERFKIYSESDDAERKVRSLKLKRVYKDATYVAESEKYKENFNVTKGVSEQNFYNFLCDKQNTKVLSYSNAGRLKFYNNMTIVSSKFLPDIVAEYSIKDKCIVRVDVEIDEPYVGRDGTPIHYIGSSDDARNIYFLNHEWVVVRFSEEQVVRSPEQCYDFIVAVIAKCISFRRTDQIEKLMKNTDILLIKRWTKDEAHTMAFRRYRNTYLERNFVENLSVEEEKKEPVLPTIPEQPREYDEGGDLPF